MKTVLSMVLKAGLYVLAFALQFWWLYLLFLISGAYRTAAKEWGWIAGIISVVLALGLPVLTLILWGCVFDVGKAEHSRKKSMSEWMDSNRLRDYRGA